MIEPQLLPAVILTLASSLGVSRSAGQCTDGFSLGNDTILCEGAYLTLNAGPGYLNYLWDNNTTAQTRIVYGAGTYTCQTTDFTTTGELAVNGNFNAGATGFTSDYVPGFGGSFGLLSAAGTYAVTTNSSFVHNNYIACVDHTSGNGSGSMLVVNGADVAGQNIWCQTIAIQSNTDYAFSAWLMSVVSSNPAELEFTVNGVSLGNPLLASFSTCIWNNFFTIWNSGAATSATICISNLNTVDSGNDFAIDDISFAPFCTYTDEIVVSVQEYPEPDLGGDISVCTGVPVTIDATWPDATYEWDEGSTNAIITPTASDTYWVDVTVNGCTGRDSIDVFFKPLPSVSFGPDQERCAGETVTLNAFVAGAQYRWQDDSDGAQFTVTGSGEYRVTVDLAGCTDADTINFHYWPLPLVDLGPDTSICADAPYPIDVVRSDGSYLWQDGSTSGQATIDHEAVYWVNVTEHGCTTRDSLRVNVIGLPEVDLGPDFLLCTGDSRELDVTGPGYSYLWQDETTAPEYLITQGDTYSVTVSNSCGEASDELVVTQSLCDCAVYVPNGFTPDGDGMNDFFLPVFACMADLFDLRIFDRWGAPVWSTTDPLTPGWDGSKANNGIYHWMLRIRTATVHDANNRDLQGHVVLVR